MVKKRTFSQMSEKESAKFANEPTELELSIAECIALGLGGGAGIIFLRGCIRKLIEEINPEGEMSWRIIKKQILEEYVNDRVEKAAKVERSKNRAEFFKKHIDEMRMETKTLHQF